ncbi:hypothetical protein ABFS83_01G057700 [Erythranthe nasuta]
MATNIESLPHEMVFEILLRLPAEDIRNEARFVCKKWYEITGTRKFVYAHLHHSPTGLIIQSYRNRDRPNFVATRRGKIEKSRMLFRSIYAPDTEFANLFWSGCNGLLLLCDLCGEDRCSETLYVTNPATNQHFPLPKCIGPAYRNSGMAYSAASTAYKVVATPYNFESGKLDCVILTAGVDYSWRPVRTQHLSLEVRKILKGIPLTTDGFIHWTDKEQPGARVLTLNVETEVITESRVDPQCCYRSERLKYYLSRGRSLTLLVSCGGLSWEFWNLEPETGEWTKQHNIDLESREGELVNLIHRSRGGPNSYPPPTPLHLVPIGWLNNGDVLAFHGWHPSSLCFLYNVRTLTIDSFGMEDHWHNLIFTSHRNSLVSLEFDECN